MVVLGDDVADPPVALVVLGVNEIVLVIKVPDLFLLLFRIGCHIYQ